MNKGKINKLPVSIYLEREFRVKLFSKAYDNAGSLGGIAVEMGYPSRPGLNGVARDMWLGKHGISSRRIEALLNLAGISFDQMIKNIVPKKKSVEIEDWSVYYKKYKSRNKSSL